LAQFQDTKRERAIKIIKRLRIATKNMEQPAITQIIEKYGQQPFLVLASCLLSLRTKDTVSLPASIRLFQVAKNPQQVLSIPIKQIENIIYPVGFYRQKAQQLHDVSKVLIEQFGEKVPDTEKELLSIKGVGPKTANLVLGEAFNVPAICVDTHVHRISNRLGLVKSNTPKETERQLKKILPQKYWVEWNRLLVMWGQNICVPISPFCSQCAIAQLCPKIGVKKSR